jgi:cell division protein FtsX
MTDNGKGEYIDSPVGPQKRDNIMLAAITSVLVIIASVVVIAIGVSLHGKLTAAIAKMQSEATTTIANWEETRGNVEKALDDIKPAIENLNEVSQVAADAADRLRQAVDAFDKVASVMRSAGPVADVLGGLVKGRRP